MSIYKRWLGRRPCLQFYSPTANYLKTRSVVQKPVQQPRAQNLYSRFQGSFLHSLGLLSVTRLLKPRCSHVSSVLIMVYFLHKGLGFPFLVLLHTSPHHYGRLSGPNGTTSILQMNYWPYSSNTLKRSTVKNSGYPVSPHPSSSKAGVLLFTVRAILLLGKYIHTVRTFEVGRWLMAKRKGHRPLKCAHKGRITVGSEGGEPATLE